MLAKMRATKGPRKMAEKKAAPRTELVTKGLVAGHGTPPSSPPPPKKAALKRRAKITPARKAS